MSNQYQITMLVCDLVQMNNKLFIMKDEPKKHKDDTTELHHYQEFGNNYQTNGLVSTPLQR